MVEGLRVAVGLLTILPVGAATVDRATTRVGIALAPLVSVALGIAAAAVLLAGRLLTSTSAPPLLPSVLAVVFLGLATRGLHLDGLADTADALGVLTDRDRALAVMKSSEVGAFGVLALLGVLAVQVSALELAVQEGRGSLALVLAVVTGRVTITWACREGVPAARPAGLGALAADSQPRLVPVGWTVLLLGAALLWGWFDDAAGPAGAARAATAVAGALVLAELARAHLTRRLGGMTGDVLGALVEGSAAVVLVVVALE